MWIVWCMLSYLHCVTITWSYVDSYSYITQSTHVASYTVQPSSHVQYIQPDAHAHCALYALFATSRLPPPTIVTPSSCCIVLQVLSVSRYVSCVKTSIGWCHSWYIMMWTVCIEVDAPPCLSQRPVHLSYWWASADLATSTFYAMGSTQHRKEIYLMIINDKFMSAPTKCVIMLLNDY